VGVKTGRSKVCYYHNSLKYVLYRYKERIICTKIIIIKGRYNTVKANTESPQSTRGSLYFTSSSGGSYGFGVYIFKTGLFFKEFNMNKKFTYSFTKDEVAVALWNQYAKEVNTEVFTGTLVLTTGTADLIFSSSEALSPLITEIVK
jgi:hypothetical protein